MKQISHHSVTSPLRIIFLLVVSVSALLILYAALEVARFSRRDETRQADAAIVLGAAVFDDQPSPVLRERINHAILLYERGLVDTIIFTGGLGYGDERTEAAVSAQYAIAHGIPPSAILLESTSTSTIENLINTKQIAAEEKLDTFLIVSTPFHMKRGMTIADAIGLEAYSSPTRTTKWISWCTKTRSYIREVVVYAAYLVSSNRIFSNFQGKRS